MDARELVISFFERAYNKKEFGYVMNIFAADYMEHTETGARSNQDCRDIIMGTCEIFPDIHVEINEIVERNDEIVAARLTFSATHKGEFFGIPATNKHIQFEAIEFFRIADGLIIESWGSWPIYDIVNMLNSPIGN